jgi:hypothetical protein
MTVRYSEEEAKFWFKATYAAKNPEIDKADLKTMAEGQFSVQAQDNHSRLQDWYLDIKAEYDGLQEQNRQKVHQQEFAEEPQREAEAAKQKQDARKKKLRFLWIFATLGLAGLLILGFVQLKKFNDGRQSSRQVDAALEAQRKYGSPDFLCLVPTTKGGAFAWGAQDPVPLTSQQYAQFFLRAHQEGLLNLNSLADAQNALASGDRTVIEKNLEAALVGAAGVGTIDNGIWVISAGSETLFTIPLGSSGLGARTHFRLNTGDTVIAMQDYSGSATVPPEVTDLVNRGCQWVRVGNESYSTGAIRPEVLQGMTEARQLLNRAE